MICFCWWNHTKTWVHFFPPMWAIMNHTWHRDFPHEHIIWLQQQIKIAYEIQERIHDQLEAERIATERKEKQKKLDRLTKEAKKLQKELEE